MMDCGINGSHISCRTSTGQVQGDANRVGDVGKDVLAVFLRACIGIICP